MSSLYSESLPFDECSHQIRVTCGKPLPQHTFFFADHATKVADRSIVDGIRHEFVQFTAETFGRVVPIHKAS